MAAEWELAMGVELGMGLGSGVSSYSNASSVAGAAGMGGRPGAYSAMPASVHHYGIPPPESLRVDDLLDLSNAHELFPLSSSAAAAGGDGHIVVKSEPSDMTAASGSRHFAGESFSSSQSYQFAFADQFYIPTEEAAELEWLSKFVDDSYSDMPTSNYSPPSITAVQSAMTAAKAMGADATLAAAGRGARSKRSRGPAVAAAAAAWHSLAPSPNTTSPSSSSSSSDFPSSKPSRGGKKLGGTGVREADIGLEGGVRRCTHCASEKTPQWRTGPLGPKTLCNACGVRYKSGRLLPEYRPAASPTFILTQHSNSHRKVVELRRQKELMVLRHRDQSAAVAAAAAADGHHANAGSGRPEFLYHGYGIC